MADFMKGLLSDPMFNMGIGLLSQGYTTMPTTLGQNLSSGLLYAQRAQQAQQQEAVRQAQLQAAQAKMAQEAAQAQARQRAISQAKPEVQGLLGAMSPSGLDAYLKNQVMPEQPKPTSSLLEYQQAVSQGYPGTFMEYQTELANARRSNVSVQNTIGPEPWKPQTTEAKSEMDRIGLINTFGENSPQVKRFDAAQAKKLDIASEDKKRLALAQGAKDDLSYVKEKLFTNVTEGKLSNTSEIRESLALSSSVDGTEGSAAYQALRRVIESTLRLRTGAQAPRSEVDEYMILYAPTWRDSDEAARRKIQALEAFLNATEESVNKIEYERGTPTVQEALDKYAPR